MTIYDWKITGGRQRECVEYIMNKRRGNSKYTVIDVGGSVNGWSAGVVDAIMDFNDPPHTGRGGVKYFKADITHPDGWAEVLRWVEEHGKFDFCICTHTLEDICNPKYVCEQLEKIAVGGFISFPSKHRELACGEGLYAGLGYRGYIHHRYIFCVNSGKLVAFPKINYLDSSCKFDRVADVAENRSDLSLFWKDTIEIEYLNGNYLGPSVEHVIRYYDKLLDRNYV